MWAVEPYYAVHHGCGRIIQRDDGNRGCREKLGEAEVGIRPLNTINGNVLSSHHHLSPRCLAVLSGERMSNSSCCHPPPSALISRTPAVMRRVRISASERRAASSIFCASTTSK